MMLRKTKIQLVLLCVLTVTAVGLYYGGNYLFDRISYEVNEQPSEISQLATDAGMNDRGRRMFYRFKPQITDEDTIRKQCGRAFHPVGCVTGNRIYILEPEQPIDEYENIVTSAHEMLHIAYDRLSEQERDVIADEISRIFPDLESEVVEDIRQYENEDPDVLDDEAHAIIGSQSDKLSPALEEHYSQYFSDRSKSVRAYQRGL